MIFLTFTFQSFGVLHGVVHYSTLYVNQPIHYINRPLDRGYIDSRIRRYLGGQLYNFVNFFGHEKRQLETAAP